MSDLINVPWEIIKNVGAGIPFLRHLKEKHSQKRLDLLEDSERPFNVFRNMLDRCGPEVDFKGKTVLEVGPGNSLAIGLLFLAHGARKVYLMDRFKHLFWDDRDVAYHQMVINKIKESDLPFADAAADAVSCMRGAITCDPSRLEYRFSDSASIPLKDGSVDCVFSNAVLEHVHNITKAIRECARVTRKGGIGIHEVDLRDHFYQETPLRLLQYSDWLWNLMTWNRPGYSNRLRYSDYLKHFKEAGFQIKKEIMLRQYAENVCEVNRQFQKYSMSELAILAFGIVLERV
jgi:SAM-dependent methyltransferase